MHVRKVLSEGLREGCTTAGVTGKLWSDVVKRVDAKLHTDLRRQSHAIGTSADDGDSRRDRDHGDRKLQPEDVLAHNIRRGMVLGMRTDNVFGISHGRGWARRRRGEAGRGGPATVSETWGCWACKRARDLRARQAGGSVSGSRTALQQREEWQQEAQTQLDTKATLKHVLCGECEGVRGDDSHAEAAARRSLGAAIEACTKSTDTQRNSNNGQQVTMMLKAARVAAQRTQACRPVSHEQWRNRWAVLAGVLPAWAESGSEEREGPTEECALALNLGVDSAVHTITKWHKSAKAGLTFVRQREQHRGLLHLVVRAWREQVEYAMPRLQAAPSLWKVRQPPRRGAARFGETGDNPDGPGDGTLLQEAGASLAGPSIGPGTDRAMAADRRDDWSTVARAARTWSPWGNGAATADGSDDEPGTEAAPTGPVTLATYQAVSRWQLRDKCLRVATYYRVMHMHTRAIRAARLRRLRARFSAWAPTFVMHTHEIARREVHDSRTAADRQTRGEQVSSRTRMRLDPRSR